MHSMCRFASYRVPRRLATKCCTPDLQKAKALYKILKTLALNRFGRLQSATLAPVGALTFCRARKNPSQICFVGLCSPTGV